jgi:uncharacterized protein (TIGR02118 family)
MIRVSVIYSEQLKHVPTVFDFDYYLSTHMPQLAKLYSEFGLTSWQVDKGISLSSRQPADFVAAAYLYFDSVDSVKEAFKTHGGTVMADVKNFTAITPHVSFSEMSSEMAKV